MCWVVFPFSCKISSVSVSDTKQLGTDSSVCAHVLQDLDSFFPISVTFVADGTISGIKVLGVTDTRSSKHLAFNSVAVLEVEEYEIG
jgi:hypothetical protein